jgi:hypothetical protein
MWIISDFGESASTFSTFFPFRDKTLFHSPFSFSLRRYKLGNFRESRRWSEWGRYSVPAQVKRFLVKSFSIYYSARYANKKNADTFMCACDLKLLSQFHPEFGRKKFVLASRNCRNSNNLHFNYGNAVATLLVWILGK